MGIQGPRALSELSKDMEKEQSGQGKGIQREEQIKIKTKKTGGKKTWEQKLKWIYLP